MTDFPSANHRTFVFLAVLGVASAAGDAQGVSIVSPSEFAATEAPDSLVPIPGGTGHVQILYEASDFSSLTGPHWITQFAFRPDGSITEPITGMADRVVYRLSTSDKTVSDMSLSFAENVGPDETVVFDAMASKSDPTTGPAGGPKDFSIIWELDDPFLFDPSLGSLLLDFDLINGDALAADNLRLPSQSSTTKWIAGGLDDSTASVQFGGIVTQFTFTPVPEPSSAMLLLLAIGAAACVVLRKLRVKTSRLRVDGNQHNECPALANGWVGVGGMAKSLFVGITVAAALTRTSAAQTTKRPIEEFLAAQGTFCPDIEGTCGMFPFPFPQNYFSWTESDTSTGLEYHLDYAGLAANWLEDNSGGAISLGTSFSGSVTEQPMADGRALVHVNLHTTDALTWVTEGLRGPADPVVFGHRASDVLAGQDAALGSSNFNTDFINTAPGAPLPDMLQLFFAPLEGQDILTGFVVFNGRADGTLREASGFPAGTPGRATMSTVGVFVPPSGQPGPHEDFFPATNIILTPVGRLPASQAAAVPEASCATLAILAILGLIGRRRGR